MLFKNQMKPIALGFVMITTSLSAFAQRHDPPCGAGVNCPPGYVRPGQPNNPGRPPGGHLPPGGNLPPGHGPGHGPGNGGRCLDYDRDGICNRWDPNPYYPDNPYHPQPPPPPYYPPSPYPPVTPYPPSPYPPPHPYPPAPYPDPGYSERRDIFVGRYMRDENMDLLSLAGLSIWADRGTIVESVEVTGQDGGYSTLLLISDGMQVATDSFPGSYSVLNPMRSLQIGITTNRVELGVRGKLFVDRVTLRIRKNGSNPGQGVNLDRSVMQNFFSGQRLDLTSVMSLYQYSGYRIASITIDGSSNSMYGNSNAQLMVNGGFAGTATFGRFPSAQMILPAVSVVIGAGYNDLQILFDGEMQVTRIRLNLVRY